MASRMLSIIFLCFVISAFSYETTTKITADSKQFHFSSSANLLKLQAEKLIRDLNLSPKDAVNIADASRDTLVGTSDSKIVEKKFVFPQLIGAAGPSIQELGHHAGYYKLPHSKAARMFYFFFESRNSKSDPVVIWLTGGPGCSSELALFYENGPFHITSNLSLVWNDYGWDQASNILFVDQPIGTGFSYTTNDSDIRHDEKGVSNDLYDFIQEFFKEHPEFFKNDFYITGESYAGHYIPAFASRVHKGNKNKEGIHINLKGFAIGNGFTNPWIQYKTYTEFSLDKKLINQSDYARINMMLPACKNSIEACEVRGGYPCMTSFRACNDIFQEILNVAGDINYYDIRKRCKDSFCYDFSGMESLLNQKPVKEALGVGDIKFVSCSQTVYNAMVADWMTNLELGIPSMLEDGIRVLIYAGEYDLICNWLGNSRWVHEMKWSGQKKFQAAKSVPFVVDGAEAGLLKSHGPLVFLKVYDAGHMVPMDQPQAALQMLENWMQGKLNKI